MHPLRAPCDQGPSLRSRVKESPATSQPCLTIHRNVSEALNPLRAPALEDLQSMTPQARCLSASGGPRAAAPADRHTSPRPKKFGPVHACRKDTTLNNIVNGKSGISPEMAIRLSKAFGSSPETWLKMQLDYDLAQARKYEDRIHVTRVQRPSDQSHTVARPPDSVPK